MGRIRDAAGACRPGPVPGTGNGRGLRNTNVSSHKCYYRGAGPAGAAEGRKPPLSGVPADPIAHPPPTSFLCLLSRLFFNLAQKEDFTIFRPLLKHGHSGITDLILE
jgi:hypothetical protein